MAERVDELIRTLAAEARPVRRLRPPLARAVLWLLGVAALAWLDWKLRGDKTAAKTFTGKDCGLCKDTNWTVKTKNWAD